MLGNALREALWTASWSDGLSWPERDAEIRRQLKEAGGAPDIVVRLVVRSTTPIGQQLPWELLLLRDEAVPLGRRAGVDLRYIQPGEEAGTRWGPPGPGALFVWADQSLSAVADRHRASLQHTLGDRLEELEHATLDALRRRLTARRDAGEAVGVLHVLCHGARIAGTDNVFGLALGRFGEVVVTGADLAAVLTDFRRDLQLVVLMSCSSAQAGDEGSPVASVASALRAQGIRAVIACRVRLLSRAAGVFCDHFYPSLMQDGLTRAIPFARRRLAEAFPKEFDWAWLQLRQAPQDDLRWPPRAPALEVPAPAPEVPAPALEAREDTSTGSGGSGGGGRRLWGAGLAALLLIAGVAVVLGPRLRPPAPDPIPAPTACEAAVHAVTSAETPTASLWQRCAAACAEDPAVCGPEPVPVPDPCETARQQAEAQAARLATCALREDCPEAWDSRAACLAACPSGCPDEGPTACEAARAAFEASSGSRALWQACRDACEPDARCGSVPTTPPRPGPPSCDEAKAAFTQAIRRELSLCRSEGPVEDCAGYPRYTACREACGEAACSF
ncbi:MAG: CHAT domain-containing protein [Alphaproteobacteria bacterium]|nr:CHAT domain-containing protein [Alphaproteobacteria bacterium]